MSDRQHDERDQPARFKRDPVFKYSGTIYNRPIGRGICLDDADNDLQLEDAFPEGDYYMELTIWPKK